ncbi:hypothetical protein BA190_26945 [Labrys sp. WJW]|nr:hypothetical protein BA190_26945 [Labrys sp. WJW]
MLLLATPLLAGCSSLTASGGIDDAAVHRTAILAACGSFEPIRYSGRDTEETQRQARAHNAAGVAICGWKP